MSGSSDELRRALEKRLRTELISAQEEYERAKVESRRLLEQSNALGLADPEGRELQRKAAVLEQRAIEKYSLAVRAFAELIVHGKGPDSGD